MKSGECQKCDAELPEEHIQLIRHTFRSYGQASGGALLPIASSIVVAATPTGALAFGIEATVVAAYLASMQELRGLEAKIAEQKQQGTDFIPGWMQKELVRLRAIETLAGTQMPARAEYASRTAAEEATRFAQ